MSRELLDVKQVREMLHLSERTVFRLIKRKELRGFKVGREWRFEQKDIDDFIERQRRKLDEDTDKREVIKPAA
jgi:excisionase family DNA binding protein